MFVRVREFIAQRLNDFSETGAVRQLFTHLQTVITTIETLSAEQQTGIGEARQRTQSRGSARNALRELLEAINAVARTMGVADRFALPDRDNDARLLQAARSHAANAVALKAEFIAHEMPDDFIEDLQAAITAFASEIAEHGNAVGDHVQAGAALDDAIDDGVDTVEKLDGIMSAKYAANRAVLAEWMSASHTERAPKRSAATAPPPSTGSAPGSITPTGTPPAA
jgi:vacuolar-type H+-ATPase subunit H